MRVPVPRLLIAAPHSGSGKSTIASGLMTALSGRWTVQGFKAGPDYIDPGYHTAASGRISRNLDTWMVPHEAVRAAFAWASRGADIAIIEGVMGLYDGYEARTEAGSTAELAKLLGAPVVLVIDAGKMARSAGAMAMGYRDFDPDLNLAGVICNNVASPRHAAWVREAVESVGLPVLGCVPRSSDLHIPERHLGLHTAVERAEEVAAFLAHARRLIAENIDLDRVWEVARCAVPFEVEIADPGVFDPVVRLAVARDEAFCFYYEDNLDLLRAAGAEIVFFSPLGDSALPGNASGLYLGGGYPELHAAQLAANAPMRESIRAAGESGMPIYAECGGLMVLTGSLTDLEGVEHAMIGLLPGAARMKARLSMGYRQVTARRDSVLMKAGQSARGHEFHYSDWAGPDDRPYAYDIMPRRAESARPEGFAQGNLHASYVHLHFASQPDLARNFVSSALTWKKERS